jgi:hypothetical protein
MTAALRRAGLTRFRSSTLTDTAADAYVVARASWLARLVALRVAMSRLALSKSDLSLSTSPAAGWEEEEEEELWMLAAAPFTPLPLVATDCECERGREGECGCEDVPTGDAVAGLRGCEGAVDCQAAIATDGAAAAFVRVLPLRDGI